MVCLVVRCGRFIEGLWVGGGEEGDRIFVVLFCVSDLNTRIGDEGSKDDGFLMVFVVGLEVLKEKKMYRDGFRS